MKNETEEVKQIWILLVQRRNRLKPHYEQTQKQLNLQVKSLGVIKCCGKYPKCPEVPFSLANWCRKYIVKDSMVVLV